MWTPNPYTPPPHRPWDDGIRWHLEQTADEAPDFAFDPLQLEFVRDHHLKCANGEIENEYVEWLIRTSYRQAANTMKRSQIPETRRMVLSQFPWGAIELPWPPLLTVDAIEYVGGDGVSGELSGSPAEYEVEAPSGPNAGRGAVRMLSSASWPSTYDQSDAVVVTFTSGYPIGDDGVALVPEDITDGRLLWIAERYKQRSLTDHAFNQNKAAIQARAMWMQYRVY